MRRSGGEAGYTFLELMLVVLILGILVTIAVATFRYTSERSQAVACAANRRMLNADLPLYLSEHDAEVTDIEDLRPYVTRFDSVIHCPADPDTTLRYDAASGRVVCDYHHE